MSLSAHCKVNQLHLLKFSISKIEGGGLTIIWYFEKQTGTEVLTVNKQWSDIKVSQISMLSINSLLQNTRSNILFFLVGKLTYCWRNNDLTNGQKTIKIK